jgi:hypothetical protein
MLIKLTEMVLILILILTWHTKIFHIQIQGIRIPHTAIHILILLMLILLVMSGHKEFWNQDVY